MHQIRFRLGLRPRPRCGSSQSPPDPVAEVKAPTFKGRGGIGEGRGREGRIVGGKGRGERIGEGEGR